MIKQKLWPHIGARGIHRMDGMKKQDGQDGRAGVKDERDSVSDFKFEI